jgi:hypothetical protein
MAKDRNELTLESLKLLQDWSKWLIALETFVCANLWPKLTVIPKPPDIPKPPASLYVSWLMFWASIITAAILLIYISVVVRYIDDKGETELRKVKLLVGIEYAFFLIGVFCLAWRIIELWLSAA